MVERSAEEFQCDTVEECFFVVTDDDWYAVSRLIRVFDGENVSECEIVK